jgi:hypothetical protein
VTIPPHTETESITSMTTKRKLIRQNSLSSLCSLEPILVTMEPSRHRLEL